MLRARERDDKSFISFLSCKRELYLGNLQAWTEFDGGRWNAPINDLSDRRSKKNRRGFESQRR